MVKKIQSEKGRFRIILSPLSPALRTFHISALWIQASKTIRLGQRRN